MEKHRAIRKGYMTIGEVAKKMNTTVRTLQFYDKEGVLSPSAESEGGRRLYADKDIIKLHQIQSMKYLGFSLDDIKNRLVALDTPAEVAAALMEQARDISREITVLSGALDAVLKLRDETLLIETVDWNKYAAIIVNLQMKNEAYRLVKHFDDGMLEYFSARFNTDSAMAIMESLSRLTEQAIHYQRIGIEPTDEKGQEFAKEYWAMVTEFTGGDVNLLSKLMEFWERTGESETEWSEKQKAANGFIEPALGAYFTKLGYNPFEQEVRHD